MVSRISLSGSGKQLPPFKTGYGVTCSGAGGDVGGTQRVSWVELQPGITLPLTPPRITTMTIDHTSELIPTTILGKYA